MNEQIASQLTPTARIFCGMNAVDNKYNVEPVAVIKPKRVLMEKKDKLSTGPKRKLIDLAKLKELYEGDLSLARISERFPVCSTTIYNVILKQIEEGYIIRRDKKSRPMIALDEASFIKQYNSGVSYRNIAEEHEVSTKKVQNYIKQLLDAGKIEDRKRV